MTRWINAVAILLVAVAIFFGLTIWVSDGVGWMLNYGSTALFIGGLVTITVWTLCVTLSLLGIVVKLLEYVGILPKGA